MYNIPEATWNIQKIIFQKDLCRYSARGIYSQDGRHHCCMRDLYGLTRDLSVHLPRWPPSLLHVESEGIGRWPPSLFVGSIHFSRCPPSLLRMGSKHLKRWPPSLMQIGSKRSYETAIISIPVLHMRFSSHDGRQHYSILNVSFIGLRRWPPPWLLHVNISQDGCHPYHTWDLTISQNDLHLYCTWSHKMAAINTVLHDYCDS